MLGQTGITGLVLAGGLSRRMGQDKALLEIQGEALLTRTCRIALPLCDRLFVITPRSTYQSLLPTGCELFREEAWRGQRTGDEAQGENNLGEGKKLEEKLKDAKPQGPLAAFHQGLARAETPWVLLLACDLPLLETQALSRAAGELSLLGPEVEAYLPPAAAKITKPGIEGKAQPVEWEPLCGFYRRGCLASLEQVLGAGRRSFQAWLPELKIAPLPGLPPEQLLNCNRPEDWQRVQVILASSSA